MSDTKTTKFEFEIELAGKWSSNTLRVLADLTDILERVPAEHRQEAWNGAIRRLEIDKKKRQSIRLVVDND